MKKENGPWTPYHNSESSLKHTLFDEMLAALKAVEPFLSVVEQHGGRYAVKAVDDAIAKAEGK